MSPEEINKIKNALPSAEDLATEYEGDEGYDSDEFVELPEVITRTNPFPIVKISSTEGSIENLAFFQQDDNGIVISSDSNLGGGYTCNLNTCLAFILIRKDEKEVEVIHVVDGIDKLLNSYKCDELIVVNGGYDCIRQDIEKDPNIKKEDKELKTQGLIKGRQERCEDISLYILKINDVHFQKDTAIKYVTANSGAIFVSPQGEVKELKDHILEVTGNKDALDSNMRDLKDSNYQFNELGECRTISKLPRMDIESSPEPSPSKFSTTQITPEAKRHKGQLIV